MGTLTSIETLFDNVKKSGAAPAPADVRAETERYASGALGGIADPETLYALFDRAFPGSPSVRRFSRSERAQRAQVSARIRHAMVLYADTYAPVRNQPGVEPWLQNLLIPTGGNVDDEDGILAEANRRRIVQFCPDTEEGRSYRQNYADSLRRDNPKLTPEDALAQTDRELAGLRGDIVEHFVREAAEITRKLDTLAGPGVPVEELAANLGRILGAKRICEAMETYLAQAESGFLSVKPETAELMRSQLALRPRLTMAANRLEAMANPLYEYFDTSRLGAYDLPAMREAWERTRAERDPAWRAEKRRKRTHFSAYVTDDMTDSFTAFLENAANEQAARNELAERQIQDTLREYGFERRKTSRFFEVPSAEDSPEKQQSMRRAGAAHTLAERENLHLYGNRPVAYHQDRLVVIFTPADTFHGVTTARPEELYNYSFTGSSASLADVLNTADRWYKTNKHGYGNMKRRLQELTRLGKLPKECTEDDVNARRAACTALLEESRRYLASKRENPQGRDDVERGRIEAAKRAETFADMKLRELDLIAKARVTASLAEEPPAAEQPPVAEQPAAEQPAVQPVVEQPPIAQQPPAQKGGAWADRADDTAKALHAHYSREFSEKAELPPPFAKRLDEALQRLEQLWKFKNLYAYNPDPDAEVNQVSGHADLALGMMLGTELILGERVKMGGKDGPMETFLKGADDEVFQDMGYTMSWVFNDGNEWSEEKAENLFRHFQPEEIRKTMDDIAGRTNLLRPAVFRQCVLMRYGVNRKETGEPARDAALDAFVNQQIVPPLLQQADKADELTASREDYRNCLAGCVAYSAVMLERKGREGKKPGPGILEQKLVKDPEGLLAEIRESQAFQQKIQWFKRKRLKLYEAVTGPLLTKNAALDFIEEYNQKLEEAGAAQNDAANAQPVKKAPDPENRMENGPGQPGQKEPEEQPPEKEEPLNQIHEDEEEKEPEKKEQQAKKDENLNRIHEGEEQNPEKEEGPLVEPAMESYPENITKDDVDMADRLDGIYGRMGKDAGKEDLTDEAVKKLDQAIQESLDQMREGDYYEDVRLKCGKDVLALKAVKEMVKRSGDPYLVKYVAERGHRVLQEGILNSEYFREEIEDAKLNPADKKSVAQAVDGLFGLETALTSLGKARMVQRVRYRNEVKKAQYEREKNIRHARKVLEESKRKHPQPAEEQKGPQK